MTAAREGPTRRLSQANSDRCRRYPIRRPGLFGSFARGEAGPHSDSGILVEFSEPIGFEVADLAMELEALLDRRADLVSRPAVSERMWPYAEEDLVEI